MPPAPITFPARFMVRSISQQGDAPASPSFTVTFDVLNVDGGRVGTFDLRTNKPAEAGAFTVGSTYTAVFTGAT